MIDNYTISFLHYGEHPDIIFSDDDRSSKILGCKSFFLSVSFVRENLRELRENFKKTHNPSCSCADGSEIKTNIGGRNTLLKRIASICGKKYCSLVKLQ